MNKAELVAAMAEKAELSKKDAEAALKAFTDVVAEELKKEQDVTHRAVKRWLSQLLKLLNSKQEKL